MAEAPPVDKEPTHFCPGCGVQLRIFARYPWYFCQDCLALAEDEHGRRLAFYNINPLGGFGWCYADDPGQCDEQASLVTCFIRKRPVAVHEARFGGIVAEPLNSVMTPLVSGHDHVRLTGGVVSETARAPLKSRQ